jgi:hypothetical protein
LHTPIPGVKFDPSHLQIHKSAKWLRSGIPLASISNTSWTSGHHLFSNYTLCTVTYLCYLPLYSAYILLHVVYGPIFPFARENLMLPSSTGSAFLQMSYVLLSSIFFLKTNYNLSSVFTSFFHIIGHYTLSLVAFVLIVMFGGAYLVLSMHSRSAAY